MRCNQKSAGSFFASAQGHIEIASDVGRDFEPDVARGLLNEVVRELLAVAVGCASDSGAVTRMPVKFVEQLSRKLRIGLRHANRCAGHDIRP